MSQHYNKYISSHSSRYYQRGNDDNILFYNYE